MPSKNATGVQKVRQKGSYLKTSNENTAMQNLIARTTNTSGSSNSRSFSGSGIRTTQDPIVVYNLEKNLSKADLIRRVETMKGTQLSKSQRRKIHATRVKSLDESHKQSRQDRFGNEIRSVRTMEAWRISYS